MFLTKPNEPPTIWCCTNNLMLFTGITIFKNVFFVQHMVNIYQSLDFVCHVSTVLYSDYAKRSLRRLSSNEARTDSKKNVLSLLNDIHANWLQHLCRFFAPRRTTTTKSKPNQWNLLEDSREIECFFSYQWCPISTQICLCGWLEIDQINSLFSLCANYNGFGSDSAGNSETNWLKCSNHRR